MTRQGIENRLLENILAVTSGMVIGKRAAERIVGGRKKLERLCIDGKISCAGKGPGQHGKWLFDLAQVLQHCRAL